MDVDPQAVINALSVQIGALQTENTILKMALNELSQQNSLLQGNHASNPDGELEEDSTGPPAA